MIARSRPGVLLALFLAAASSARAAGDPAVVTRATKLLEEISSNPDSGIPARFLREARGITIMPGVVETELVVGRKRGRGVFVPRKDDGQWGDPEPAEVSGLSVDASAGRDVRDIVMIYRTKKAADGRGGHALSLGVDVRAYVLPKDRRKFSGPGPDSKSGKEIFIYERHRGILVGAEIQGEHKWGDAPPAGDPKAPPDPKAPAVASPRLVEADRADSPEVARLKAVLMAMTRPPGPAAEPATGDRKVRPARGCGPPPAWPSRRLVEAGRPRPTA